MIRWMVRSGDTLQHNVTADHRMKPAMARWTVQSGRTCLREITAIAPLSMAAIPAAALMLQTIGISVACVIGIVKTKSQSSTNAMRVRTGREVLDVICVISLNDRIVENPWMHAAVFLNLTRGSSDDTRTILNT